MFTTADLKHVDGLHHYGRQLAVLKRIYESYNNIIERVLDGPKQMEYLKASSDDVPVASRQGLESSEIGDTAITSSIGVPLSTTARVRFERLKDRITLYALSEIKDCIDEKDALVMLVCTALAFEAIMITHGEAEFQSYCDQGVLCRRELDPYHNPSSQSHNALSTRQLDDHILHCPAF